MTDDRSAVNGEAPVSDDPLSALINGDRAFRSMRDRWWLLVLTPALAMTILFLMGRWEPYTTSVQATVLIPGDTEVPGSSERPELMMLDDLPTLVRSRVFAEGVHEALSGTSLSVDEVQATLDGSRYSRIVTVTISDEDEAVVSEVASGVEQQLPQLINEYLVAEDGDPATVRVINPAGAPSRSNDNLLVQMLLTGMSGFVLGTVIATILGPKRAT